MWDMKFMVRRSGRIWQVRHRELQIKAIKNCNAYHWIGQTTRFFVVGDNGDLDGDAGNPYAVASAPDFLQNGWPVLEQDESKQDLFDEETLFLYADRYLREHLPPISDIKVTVNGSFDPVIGTYAPGDWCSIIIDDEFVRMRLASNLEPRDTFLIRKINGFRVSVPDTPTFPEEVELDLVTEAEVDQIGKQQA